MFKSASAGVFFQPTFVQKNCTNLPADMSIRTNSPNSYNLVLSMFNMNVNELLEKY